MYRRLSLILLIIAALFCALLWWLVENVPARPVAAQALTLERIGPNADRPLRIGEAGWLIGPGTGDVGRCEGCALVRLDCATVCTYRVTALRLDWSAEVEGAQVAQGRRLWLPVGGR